MTSNISHHPSTNGQGDLFQAPTPRRPVRLDGEPFGRNLCAATTGSPDRRPSVDDLLPRMLAALDVRGWVSARVLASELGTDDRSLREAAHRSDGHVLGGQRGYILTVQASVEDVRQVTAWVLSQSNRMRARVSRIELVFHHKGRAL